MCAEVEGGGKIGCQAWRVRVGEQGKLDWKGEKVEGLKVGE